MSQYKRHIDPTRSYCYFCNGNPYSGYFTTLDEARSWYLENGVWLEAKFGHDLVLCYKGSQIE